MVLLTTRETPGKVEGWRLAMLMMSGGVRGQTQGRVEGRRVSQSIKGRALKRGRVPVVSAGAGKGEGEGKGQRKGQGGSQEEQARLKPISQPLARSSGSSRRSRGAGSNSSSLMAGQGVEGVRPSRWQGEIGRQLGRQAAAVAVPSSSCSAFL